MLRLSRVEFASYERGRVLPWFLTGHLLHILHPPLHCRPPPPRIFDLSRLTQLLMGLSMEAECLQAFIRSLDKFIRNRRVYLQRNFGTCFVSVVVVREL